MGKVYRHFSREFKLNAVQMVMENGEAVSKVARELDIHPNLLHLWKRKYLAEGDKAFVGKGRAKPDDVKLRRLRRELRKVKEERDIKKMPWPRSPDKKDEVPVHGRTQGKI